jgi:hypothetical protein
MDEYRVVMRLDHNTRSRFVLMKNSEILFRQNLSLHLIHLKININLDYAWKSSSYLTENEIRVKYIQDICKVNA